MKNIRTRWIDRLVALLIYIPALAVLVLAFWWFEPLAAKLILGPMLAGLVAVVISMLVLAVHQTLRFIVGAIAEYKTNPVRATKHMTAIVLLIVAELGLIVGCAMGAFFLIKPTGELATYATIIGGFGIGCFLYVKAHKIIQTAIFG